MPPSLKTWKVHFLVQKRKRPFNEYEGEVSFATALVLEPDTTLINTGLQN